MSEKTIKVWITRYALTKGILETDATLISDSSSIRYVFDGLVNYAHGKDWHRTPEAAMERAEEMRKARLESLRKSIDLQGVSWGQTGGVAQAIVRLERMVKFLAGREPKTSLAEATQQAFGTLANDTSLDEQLHQTCQQAKPTRRVPCGPEDFPPGLCCVKRNLDSQCRVVIRTSPEGFEAAGWDFRFFSDLVGDTVVRSLDGGKTWLPCWKEVV